jgi:hypothetical protein
VKTQRSEKVRREKKMTVREHVVAMGINPDAARTVIGDGSLDCPEIKVTTSECKPWDYFTKAIRVEAVACVEYTDGMVRPAKSWYGSNGYLTMYFEQKEVK